MAKKWKQEEKDALDKLSRLSSEDILKRLDELSMPKQKKCIACDSGPIIKKRGKYCEDCLKLGNQMYNWSYVMKMVWFLKMSYEGKDAITVLSRLLKK